MDLRPELMPPAFDEALVARLAKLADRLDGCRHCDAELAEFNRLAGTSMGMEEFQGVYSAVDPDVFVRDVLARPYVRSFADITRAELVEITRRVMAGQGSENAVSFWLLMLAANLPDPNVSDLIYWPDVYFEDGERRELTPEQVVDVASAKRRPPA